MSLPQSILLVFTFAVLASSAMGQDMSDSQIETDSTEVAQLSNKDLEIDRNSAQADKDLTPFHLDSMEETYALPHLMELEYQMESKAKNDTKSSGDDDHKSSGHKWIVIAFSAICVFILVLCIVLIIVASIRRTRVNSETEAEGNNVDPVHPNGRRGSQQSRRSSRRNSHSNQARHSRQAEREHLYMPLSTVSEKSDYLEATNTMISSAQISNRFSHSNQRES